MAKDKVKSKFLQLLWLAANPAQAVRENISPKTLGATVCRRTRKRSTAVWLRGESNRTSRTRICGLQSERGKYGADKRSRLGIAGQSL